MDSVIVFQISHTGPLDDEEILYNRVKQIVVIQSKQHHSA